MVKTNMVKISLRIEPTVLRGIDNIVDNVIIKNRSDAIRSLVKKSMDKERTAVILSKGTDTKYFNVDDRMKLENGEYNITAKLPNKKTLVEEQIELLRNNGFKKIFIISLPEIIIKIKDILGKRNYIKYIENNKGLKTMDALRLLKGMVDYDFLCFFGHDYPNMDLNEILNEHVNNHRYATINMTWGSSEAKSYLKVNGTKIVYFEEKSSKVPHLTFNSVFVLNPRFLDEKGHSLVYDVFPRVAKRGLLNGFITDHRILKVLSIKDKEKVMKQTIKTRRSFKEQA